jgi:hypothetical protein
MHIPQSGALLRSPTQRRLRHPFDSAGSTIALGVILTAVLMLALRLLGG